MRLVIGQKSNPVSITRNHVIWENYSLWRLDAGAFPVLMRTLEDAKPLVPHETQKSRLTTLIHNDSLTCKQHVTFFTDSELLDQKKFQNMHMADSALSEMWIIMSHAIMTQLLPLGQSAAWLHKRIASGCVWCLEIERFLPDFCKGK